VVRVPHVVPQVWSVCRGWLQGSQRTRGVLASGRAKAPVIPS
jgi:hypothetical protein